MSSFQCIQNHEGGSRHQANIQKKLNEVRKSKKENSAEKVKEKVSVINDVCVFFMLEPTDTLFLIYVFLVDGIRWNDERYRKGPISGQTLRYFVNRYAIG